MRWLNAHKLWSEPASQREQKGLGGVGLPTMQGTVPVWGVPSSSLPTSFWLCPPSPEPAPSPLWNLLSSKMAEGPESWGGSQGAGGGVLGNKEQFQGSLTPPPPHFFLKEAAGQGDWAPRPNPSTCPTACLVPPRTPASTEERAAFLLSYLQQFRACSQTHRVGWTVAISPHCP